MLLLFVTLGPVPFVCGEDGTYDATVTTDSGSYTVPVEVEGDEVAIVHWPNGGDMHVHGADVDSEGEASGYNSRGDRIEVAIDNYESSEEDANEE